VCFVSAGVGVSVGVGVGVSVGVGVAGCYFGGVNLAEHSYEV
jgi:hypothetical protein